IASNTRRDCIRGTPPIRHYSLDQAFAMSGWGWAGTAAAMRPACSFLDGALAEGREMPAHRLQRRFGVRYEAPVDLDLGDDLVHPPLRAEASLHAQRCKRDPPGPRVGAPAMDQPLPLELADLEGNARRGDDYAVADLPLGKGPVVEDVEDVERHRGEAERLEDPGARGLDGRRGGYDFVDEGLHS